MSLLSKINSPTTSWMPLRAYLYDIMLPVIPGMDGKELLVSKQIQTASIPTYSVSDTRSTYNGAEKFSFPGKQNIANIELTIFETEDLVVYKYFQAWRSLQQQNGRYFPRAHYRKTVTAKLYSKAQKSGTAQTLFDITLGGCWPVTYPQMQLTYSESKPVTYSVSINVDGISCKVGYVPTGVGSGAIASLVKPPAAVSNIMNMAKQSPFADALTSSIPRSFNTLF